MKIDGFKLTTLRNERKLSRLDLACELDCSEHSIAKIERGERSGVCLIYKIAKYFNVSIESLIE